MAEAARPKEILYPDVAIDVQPGRTPGVVKLVVIAPGEVLIFPMGAEYARELGLKLSAPRIITKPE